MACGPADQAPFALVAVSFNTGTSEDMGHDEPPDDGYSSAHAAFSDQYYGDGLAWRPAVVATRDFLAGVRPDLVAFQEIFDPEACPGIPPEARADFVCETWQPGDGHVAEMVLGAGYQVACHPGSPDKCVGLRRSFGSFRGCGEAVCPGALEGSRIPGCGSSTRVARGVVELVAGGELCVVSVHGTSGMNADDQACRALQVERVFVDLGDGRPAASGERNVILGDFNTDPGRLASFDPSAVRWNDFTGPGKGFHFVSPVGPDAPPSYAGLFNIDHVVSDALEGSCWAAGVSPGRPRVIEARYFDHAPLVCALGEAP
jgi:endonuclease/exonuclease/phosphatase family metal-dependent hydrolase